MSAQTDPVTGRPIAEHAAQQDDARWEAESLRHCGELARTDDPRALCHALYRFLDGISLDAHGARPRVPLCPHAPDSYLPDHVLLTSALAYCLAGGAPADAGESGEEHGTSARAEEVHLLRLAALSHEFPPAARAELRERVPAHAPFLEAAWAALEQQAATLAQEGDTLAALANARPPGEDARVHLLWYAHLVAAQPLGNRVLTLADGTRQPVVQARADFARHPLAAVPERWRRVGLVFGGATKVKEYVFESARLPEIRGASVLLDRLNQSRARALFRDAPECVIYANGGDLLALTPREQASRRASEIEALYAEETLTAGAVAAASTFSLLEVQYGLQPEQFWVDQYLAQLGSGESHGEGQGEGAGAGTGNAEKAALLRGYYGDPRHREPGADGATWSDEMLFHRRKGFGELTTALALQRMWRREGNDGVWRNHPPVDPRTLPHLETLPHGHYCSSCDRRTTVLRVPDLEDDLCEPCLRKRWMGMYMRRGPKRDEAFRAVTAWRPQGESAQDESAQDKDEQGFLPWYQQFERYLDAEERSELKAHYLRDCVGRHWKTLTQRQDTGGQDTGGQDTGGQVRGIDNPDRLDELAQTATPSGYIGLVYADGNNVGALLETIRTPAAYRQFAGRLFRANQSAVFDALATHLQPALARDEKENLLLIHPFEIISVGGDDLFLVVPAERALEIAHAIGTRVESLFANGDPGYAERGREIQRFQPEAFQAEGRPRVSLSAGVVLASKSTPFFFLTDIVDELLKSAKKAAKERKDRGYYGGTVDFMTLKSISMVTTRVESFRQTALTETVVPSLAHSNGEIAAADGCDVLHLTACPYTMHELAGLLHTVRALQTARFPRSQLYQLRELLPQGRLASSLGYLYFSIRTAKTELLRSALDQAWCDPQREPVPWRRRPEKVPEKRCDGMGDTGNEDGDPGGGDTGDGGTANGHIKGVTPHHWETVLADVIDLYDFVVPPAATTDENDPSGDAPHGGAPNRDAQPGNTPEGGAPDAHPTMKDESHA